VSAADPTTTLLLFDIDGTLLHRATAEHAEALHLALKEVHGVEITASARASLSPAGRTDGEIARVLLLNSGVSARRIDERAVDVRVACCEIFARLVPPDLSDKVLAGIPELLDELDGYDNVRLSLVTGNFEPIARLKLGHAGIGDHFPSRQGGFGSDDEDRAALPHIARKRAGHDGIEFPRAHTIVIGDTPRDIACARADDVRCYAVATGPFGVDELQSADAVAEDPRQLGEQLRALLS
jgi:phosphoglycolate phosphatase-like HAD superfamily hydrolase